MVQLLKDKIETLISKNAESIKELDKYLGVGIFIVRKDAESVSPLQPEYIKAISDLSDIQDSKESDFDKKKYSILTVINTLISDKKKYGGDMLTMDKLFHGANKNSLMNELRFRLLMVEQNNIDYFKKRDSTSHTEYHDRLSSHMYLRLGSDSVDYLFIRNSGLDESIKTEAAEVIHGIQFNK